MTRQFSGFSMSERREGGKKETCTLQLKDDSDRDFLHILFFINVTQSSEKEEHQIRRRKKKDSIRSFGNREETEECTIK